MTCPGKLFKNTVKLTGSRRERTFQKVLRSIQALGGKLVVTKRPQKLADDDVGFLGGLPLPHITRHHRHLIAPLLEAPVLQTIYANTG